MITGNTMEPDTLALRIRKTGFSCTRCGACCRGSPEDGNLVMVTPAEIDRLVSGTGLDAGSIAEPYPGWIRTDDGGGITFEWCLRRNTSGCIFLEGNHCMVYDSRPWICRTYPFMLDGEQLIISPCDGIGREIQPEEARELAGLVLQRRYEEEQEEERVRSVLSAGPIPAGKRVLIDGRGVRLF